MSRVEDGGPAFPGQARGPDGLPMMEAESGMSLRDYAAIHLDTSAFEFHNADDLADALGIARLKIGDALDVIRFGCEANAAVRYRMADAMLKARSKP